LKRSATRGRRWSIASRSAAFAWSGRTATVEAKGGDLFVNRIGSSEPEDPAFVPPERRQEESASDYRGRIDAAAGALRQR
jgi:hypothetical protein